MKYLKIFEDFERSAYTKISPKILNRGNQYLQEICPFLNLDLYEEVLVIPGGYFLYNETEYDSIESLIESVHKYALNIWDYRKSKYTINNGLIDVKGDVKISVRGLTKIPYKFGEVTGDFLCNENKLTNLKGAPYKVEGDFLCASNKLTTLEYSPHTVGKNFQCSFNQLTTLEGAPHTVGGHFWCYNNQLITLKGAPHTVGGGFVCSNNQLTNLKYLPEKINSYINCLDNPNLIDFSDVPEEWKDKIIK